MIKKQCILIVGLCVLMACTEKKDEANHASTVQEKNIQDQHDTPAKLDVAASELKQEDTKPNPSEKTALNAVPIYSEELGWGYDITMDGKAVIHQPHIPAVAGGKGFKSKEEALKVAKLVMAKIQNNMMPPSITKGELDSLGVKY